MLSSIVQSLADALTNTQQASAKDRVLLALERQIVKKEHQAGLSHFKQLRRQRQLTSSELIEVLKILTFYKTSLNKNGISLPTSGELWKELATGETQITKTPIPSKPKQTLTPINSQPKRVSWLGNNTIGFHSPYNPAVNIVVRQLIKHFGGSGWNSGFKCWQINFNALEAILFYFPETTAYPALEQWVDYFKTQRKTEYLKLLSTLGDLNAPFKDGKILRQYQQIGIKKILWWKHMIVADDLGLGKTLMTLTAAKAYQLPVKVIAPVSVQRVWEKEADNIEVDVETYSWGKFPESFDGPYVLILDEAHAIQNFKAKRTQKALILASNAKVTLPVTGTPVKHGLPIHLLPLLTVIRHPLSFDKKAFEYVFCDAHRMSYEVVSRDNESKKVSVWDTSGSTKLHELYQIISPILLRRTKEECTDLPPKTRIYRPVELSLEAQRIYDERFLYLKNRYDERVRAGTAIGNGEAMVILSALLQAGSIAKIEDTLNVVQEVREQNHKAIIFTMFVESAQILAAKLGVEPLTGSTPRKKRDLLIENFQNGVTDYFVGTLKAGGMGITLTAADVNILMDRPWSPGDAFQAEDRIHRLSQTRHSICIWSQYGLADEHVDLILSEKHRRIGTILTGSEWELSQGESIEKVAPQLLQVIFNS